MTFRPLLNIKWWKRKHTTNTMSCWLISIFNRNVNLCEMLRWKILTINRNFKSNISVWCRLYLNFRCYSSSTYNPTTREKMTSRILLNSRSNWIIAMCSGNLWKQINVFSLLDLSKRLLLIIRVNNTKKMWNGKILSSKFSKRYFVSSRNFFKILNVVLINIVKTMSCWKVLIRWDYKRWLKIRFLLWLWGGCLRPIIKVVSNKSLLLKRLTISYSMTSWKI